MAFSHARAMRQDSGLASPAMKYKRFEELPVWRAAMELAERVFRLTGDRRFGGQGDLRSQLQRASLSICNNVAEGFERGTTQELISFLYIARGSAGEVRSILLLMERLPRFGDLKSEISDLRSQSESISRQLKAWAQTLQGSPIKGPRHLTTAERERFDKRVRAEAFRKKPDRLIAAKTTPPANQG
jgi:four helix bundle protein